MRLAAHGISAEVPGGWGGEVYLRDVPEEAKAAAAASGQAEPVAPSLHLATFPLPAGRGDYGGGAVERMRADDIFVAVLEFDRASAGTPLFDAPPPTRIVPGAFHPQQLQRTLSGQSGVQRFFTADGRAFCLYVVLGAHASRFRSAPRVDVVLDGLSFG